MVQLGGFGKFRPPPEKGVVKVEVEDQLEEEHGPLNKKTKLQWDEDPGMVPQQSLQISLLEEPSPLGLRLRKSPSLLDLIQMRLSQENSASASCPTSSVGFEAAKKKDLKSTAVSGTSDKLKASNFPASLLRIGSWECVSRYEGDLVAKCYYAKHKLVWEVLDGGLKSKIEIQWSDITALKATCPDNVPGSLDIVLARQPLFFRETNPQPRKHTLWQATSDFTNGQASIHRRHFLQCPPGLLSKHFEKLIQCDPRLHSLSQQPEILLDSPYFDPRSSVFEDHDESNKCHGFDDLKGGFTSSLQGLQDHVSASTTPSTSSNNEIRVSIARTPDSIPTENLSPSSAMDSQTIEANSATSRMKDLFYDPKRGLIKIPGLSSSMSMSDLMNHVGHCISGKTTPGNPLLQTDSSLNKAALEEITQYLLGDSQGNSASNEQSIMSRVDSLCCLIKHKDSIVNGDGEDDDASDDDSEDNEDKKPSMSRKESYGELLINLPRIQSMPFLFNIAEDSENQAR